MFVSSLPRGEKNAVQGIDKYSNANTVPRYFFVSWLALVTHAENALVLISPALGERHLFFSISFPFPQLYIHILGFSSPSLLIFQQVLLIFFKMGRYGGQRNCTTGSVYLQVYSTAKCSLLHCTCPAAKINPSLLSLRKQPRSIAICNLLYHTGDLFFPVWIRERYNVPIWFAWF